jgi:hypothetical protein
MTAPNDNFETYFTEKLWDMIPAFYRDQDGLAENPGVLRALVHIIAQHAAVLRRSNDSLWNDPFIDLCNSWAVPYLADLVGTRLVSSLNLRARRIDVAKTIYYRRRKGTVRVLEELISDMTGWDGTVVEEFRRLARACHGLDVKPGPQAGRFTGTPPGGFADLRRPRGSELTGGPFDEYFHTPDLRRQRGTDGVYNIPKLGVHLYRLTAFQVTGVTPCSMGGGFRYTFDPSGRDVPLFSARYRDAAFDWETWRPAREWELPAPIRCRELGHAEYLITEAVVLALDAAPGLSAGAASDLRTLLDQRFPSETALQTALSFLAAHVELLNSPVYPALLRAALLSDCGKAALIPDSVRVESTPGVEVAREAIVTGNLSNWAAASDKELVIDPERGRMLFLSAGLFQPLADCYYGFSAPIGAGTYERSQFLLPHTVPPLSANAAITAAEIDAGTPAARGVTELTDSSTFGPAASKTGIQNTQIQAAGQQRPYLRIAADWVLDTTPHAQSILVLDGLWIGTAGKFSLILAGDYTSVTIRNSTLDPGGVDALGNAIAPVPLVIEGNVETLILDHSIVSSIALKGGSVKQLTITDSIVDSSVPGGPAIDLPATRADVQRTTVMGAVNADRLYASEAILAGLADIADTQDGCFRFSAAITKSRVPHPYESHFIDDAAHYFTSLRFGDPGYCQLSQSAPPGLLTGAENDSEIGAFSSLLNPIRLDGLKAKLDEYMPFGLIPVFVFET